MKSSRIHYRPGYFHRGFPPPGRFLAIVLWQVHAPLLHPQRWRVYALRSLKFQTAQMSFLTQLQIEEFCEPYHLSYQVSIRIVPQYLQTAEHLDSVILDNKSNRDKIISIYPSEFQYNN